MTGTSACFFLTIFGASVFEASVLGASVFEASVLGASIFATATFLGSTAFASGFFVFASSTNFKALLLKVVSIK